MSNLGAHPQVITVNKSAYNNSPVMNSSAKGSISSPQLIGISSIIANSQNRGNSVNYTTTNHQNSSPQPLVTKQLNNISPSVRFVVNNAKPSYGVSSNVVHTSSAQNMNITSQNIVSQPLTKVTIGANNAIHNLNLTTVASEQKVLPNGSTHLQSVQLKDGSVISQQIMKNGANHVVIKREQGDISSNSVIQGVHQSMVSSGTQQIIKGIGGESGRGVVRTPTPITQQNLLQATVGTMLGNSSPSVSVSAVATGVSSMRPALHIRPGQVRITNPVRAQHPTLAPRQQTPHTNTLTLPQGALLMRNENGQLVLVSAPQGALQQAQGGSTVITSMASSGGRLPQGALQQAQGGSTPLTTQASVRAAGNGQTMVTIQPQVQQQQPVQVRAAAMTPTVMSTRSLQPSTDTVTKVLSGQSATVSVSQPVPANIASNTGEASGDTHKAMLENVNKCKNFLSTLINLAASQPKDTVKNVKALIQGLLDGKVEPEVFTERLQRELQSSPQPYLVPFLKKSLPVLRYSLIKGLMTIDGIKPPPPAIMAQTQPVGQTTAPPRIITQQVITPRPVVAAHTIRTSMPQVTQLPGPQASRAAVVRQTLPQMAVTQSGNKVLVPALPRSHSTLAQASPRIAVQPFPQMVRPARPALSAVTIKPEPSTPAAGYREKRKFESLKDGDDDINDVATMGGVNLSEESKNILATTNADAIGAHLRSCKDEIFLPATPLLRKITAIAKKYGIEEISPGVVSMISHATQERLRCMVANLSTIAEHRVEMYKFDNRYEAASDTKHKLKFLEELDKLERKRHEEQEREKLLRAIKSRSKNEDPEQLKLKQKAKELQQMEAEELRQKEANQTALAAIGPRKKRKLDFLDSSKTGAGAGVGSSDASTSSSMSSVMRPRIKRVNMRDVQLLMESERPTRKSELLYKSYLK
ncbi:unnamed protein product [Candidula unifasciata]|uniref:TAFH domain-containing protein n=1 Tax=Candidula unifasciata TaxID=100452 RepID=A0A8S3ZX68_9EUPU|nr:unnamed protein product [Candidula unifasciata]